MQRVSKSGSSKVLLVAFLSCWFLSGQTQAARSDLTVADYCRLTVSLMGMSVQEWQERVPIAQQNKGDRRKLEAALKDVTKKYQDRRGESYSQFGTNQHAYLQYTSDHKTEIESYLEENPDVQHSIDDLKTQIDNLIQQFESAAAPEGEKK